MSEENQLNNQAVEQFDPMSCSDAPDIEIVRVGDDPFDRDEPTVFYRHRSVTGAQVNVPIGEGQIPRL